MNNLFLIFLILSLLLVPILFKVFLNFKAKKRNYSHSQSCTDERSEKIMKELFIFFSQKDNEDKGQTVKKPPIPTLFFKSNKAAFEYEVKYMHNPLVPNEPLIAIVDEAGDENKDGYQSVTLRVAIDGKVFKTMSITINNSIIVKKNDLVVYHIIEMLREPNEKSGIFFAAGFVVAVLLPIYDIDKEGWRVSQQAKN